MEESCLRQTSPVSVLRSPSTNSPAVLHPKTRNPEPDDPTLLQPPMKLPPLRLKQLPPSNPPSPSLSSSSKTRTVSPFAPPPSFKLKLHPDSDSHSSGPPTPYWRCSSARAKPDSDAPLRRWRVLKSLRIWFPVRIDERDLVTARVAKD